MRAADVRPPTVPLKPTSIAKLLDVPPLIPTYLIIAPRGQATRWRRRDRVK